MKSRKNGHYSVKNGLPITYYLLPREALYMNSMTSSLLSTFG